MTEPDPSANGGGTDAPANDGGTNAGASSSDHGSGTDAEATPSLAASDDVPSDPEALRAELGQIKRAVGLAESHPYWWRMWLVEGLGVALLFPLFNVGFVYGFSIPVVGGLLAVFAGHQYALYRVQRAYDEPTTGIPDWGRWHLGFFAGLFAWIVGLSPVLDAVPGLAETPLIWVGAGIVMGVAFFYMGQLLGAYHIRSADRNAFYLGGSWLLAVSAALPWLPDTVQDWAFATLGLAYGLYCLVAYVVLARR
ncbi:hypothetical protein [Halovivax limisalsi]|uniref:hypothetical protein n=1 Tax=Halovivax limisalsi TaxID=1453760 RepID=UPI001FFDC20D|nr:hypothetical protein [Halovivax limisalsi]